MVMVIRLGEVSGTACKQTGGLSLMFAGSFFQHLLHSLEFWLSDLYINTGDDSNVNKILMEHGFITLYRKRV